MVQFESLGSHVTVTVAV